MKPILEIRHNRFIYLGLAPIPLMFSGLFFFILFLAEEPIPRESDTIGTLIFGFFIPVGIFLSVHWFLRFLKDTPVFSILEDGIISNTHGVSSGLIRWQDIRKIEEQEVRDGRGASYALAIYFKQEGRYEQEQPLLVRMLRWAVKATGIHKIQRLSDSDETELPVLIPISSLGVRYEQVKKIMDEKIAAHSGK